MQPTLRVGFCIGLQYLGNHRRQWTNVLFIKRKNVGFVWIGQGIGSLDLSQRQTAFPQPFKPANALWGGWKEQNGYLRVFDGLRVSKQQLFFKQFRQGFLPAGVLRNWHVVQQNVELNHV